MKRQPNILSENFIIRKNAKLGENNQECNSFTFLLCIVSTFPIQYFTNIKMLEGLID